MSDQTSDCLKCRNTGVVIIDLRRCGCACVHGLRRARRLFGAETINKPARDLVTKG